MKALLIECLLVKNTNKGREHQQGQGCAGFYEMNKNNQEFLTHYRG
jgi:hypothetical protein